MNLKKSILAFTTAATILTGMMPPMGTMAATAYTPVAGKSCNFNTYFIMDAGDTVPNATFSYSVAAGTARSANTSDNTVMQVLAGVGKPTIADITFTNKDTTVTATTGLIDVTRTQEDRTGTVGTDAVQLDSGEKFSSKQATVDFSKVKYDEPGIYRYVITQTANSGHEAAGIRHDTDVERILDVYVTDTGAGALAVSAYVLHISEDDVVINNTMGSGDVATAGTALDDKTDGFTNEYTSKDIVFKKSVSGNQASRDKWFEFTATVTNLNDKDVYVVSLANDNNANTTDGNADAVSGTTTATRKSNQEQTNPTSVTGEELKSGVKFYLQHGQSIAIRGLALNGVYTISEDAEDYKSTGAKVTDYTDAVTGTVGTIAGDNKVIKTSYLNERNGVIPTGVVSGSAVTACGVAILCAAYIASTFYFKRRRA